MSLPQVLLNMLEQSHRMQLIFRDARLPQTQQQCVVVGPLSSSPERPRPDFPSRKAIPDRVAWTKLGGVAAAQLNSAAVRLDGGLEALAAGDFSLRFVDAGHRRLFGSFFLYPPVGKFLLGRRLLGCPRS